MRSQGPCQAVINGQVVGIIQQGQIDSGLAAAQMAAPQTRLGTIAQKIASLPLKRSVMS
jgi:hypothetical protein